MQPSGHKVLLTHPLRLSFLVSSMAATRQHFAGNLGFSHTSYKWMHHIPLEKNGRRWHQIVGLTVCDLWPSSTPMIASTPGSRSSLSPRWGGPKLFGVAC